MTSPAGHAEDPDRTLADFFAEIEQSGGRSLTADEHRVLAAETHHDGVPAEQYGSQPRDGDTAGSMRRAALDQMVQIAEEAGMYERTAEPRRTR